MIKCTLWFARNIPDERGQAPKPVAAAQPECLARSATFRKMAKRLGCQTASRSRTIKTAAGGIELVG
jgi:hypothetical protein